MNGSILIFDKNASTFRNEGDIHRHYEMKVSFKRDNDSL